jgi:hypothetical protein
MSKRVCNKKMILDPIWLFVTEEEEVPVKEEEAPVKADTKSKDPFEDSSSEEVLVEDEVEDEETTPSEPKTVKVMVDKWVQLNAQAPLWMR